MAEQHGYALGPSDGTAIAAREAGRFSKESTVWQSRQHERIELQVRIALAFFLVTSLRSSSAAYH
jgi:hypothetical protein